MAKYINIYGFFGNQYVFCERFRNIFAENTWQNRYTIDKNMDKFLVIKVYKQLNETEQRQNEYMCISFSGWNSEYIEYKTAKNLI